MNRRFFLKLVSVSALGLAACEFAPDRAPDLALITLGSRLLADASYITAERPDLAAVCTRQGEALLAEANRLCGHFSDGSAPQSCQIPDDIQVPPPTSGTPKEVMANTAAAMLDQVAAIDASSMPLLCRLYTELVVLSEQPGTLPDGEIPADDVPSATSALQWEYGAEYGLSVAQAFADQGLYQQIGDAITSHREMIASLQAVLSDPPVSAAGYSFDGYPTPVDNGTALTVAEQLQSDGVEMWYARAAEATSAHWARFAMIAAGITAITANPFVDARGTKPWEASYLQY